MKSTNEIRPSTTVADILCDQCQTPLIEIDSCGERLEAAAPSATNGAFQETATDGIGTRGLAEARPISLRSGFLLQRTTAAVTEKKVFGIDSVWRRGRSRRDGGQDARRSQRVSSARAQLCVHLAKGASTPEQRDHFAKLARTWIKLAEELEQTEAFLAAIEDDELTKQTGQKKAPTSEERGQEVEEERQLTAKSLGYRKAS